MASLGAAPKPKSALGYYRILSPNASVRVSPLCLGAMNFGDAWKGFMGECNQKTTEGILDFFYEQGGNFIDTYALLPCFPALNYFL
jgi:predicted aldo/keto reductase-like oxidoreductase